MSRLGIIMTMAVLACLLSACGDDDKEDGGSNGMGGAGDTSGTESNSSGGNNLSTAWKFENYVVCAADLRGNNVHYIATAVLKTTEEVSQEKIFTSCSLQSEGNLRCDENSADSFAYANDGTAATFELDNG